jgi:hypothetical protein
MEINMAVIMLALPTQLPCICTSYFPLSYKGFECSKGTWEQES